jgi:hypothetical protein
MKNLSAAAHLIHGSSEGRFKITYCPGGLSKEEVEGVGFSYADLATMTQRYQRGDVQDGWNETADGEKYFYISNPALGLWAFRGRFEGSSVATPSTEAAGGETKTTSLAPNDASQPCVDAGVGGGPFQQKTA